MDLRLLVKKLDVPGDFAPPRQLSYEDLWWVTPSSYDAGYYIKAYRALRTWLAAEYPFWNGYFSNKEIPDDGRSPSA
jgi:hypothetical protein